MYISINNCISDPFHLFTFAYTYLNIFTQFYLWTAIVWSCIMHSCLHSHASFFFFFFVNLSMQIYEFNIDFCCKYPRQLTRIFKASCAHSLLCQVSFHCCNWKERMSEWKILKFRTEGLRNIDYSSSHFYSFYTWYSHTAHHENSTAPVSSWQNSVVRLLFACVQTKSLFNILRFCSYEEKFVLD